MEYLKLIDKIYKYFGIDCLCFPEFFKKVITG